MRIVVCVKHVPDAQSDRRFEDGRLVRGEDDVLNELDENAVEAAVSAVEEHCGEVVALTMGPEGCDDVVLRALQMGADRGFAVTDDALAGADVRTTARVLAAAIRRIEAESGGADLVLAGMASGDGMTSMLPAALAATLGRPLLGLAHEVTVEDGERPRVRIRRATDDFDDVLTAEAPLVLTVTDQANEPRYPSFKTMKAARMKPLDEWSLDDLDLTVGEVARGIEVLDVAERVREGRGTIVTDSGDGGERLAEYLLTEGK